MFLMFLFLFCACAFRVLDFLNNVDRSLYL
jgi:hypothetical protein